MLRSILRFFLFAGFAFSSASAPADIEEIRHQLNSEDPSEIRLAIGALRRDGADASLFSDLEAALDSCWRQDEKRLAKTLVRSVAALAQIYPYEGALALFDLLRFDYEPIQLDARIAFSNHPWNGRILKDVLADEFAPPFRVSNLLVALEGADEESLPFAIRLLRKAFGHKAGSSDERNLLYQAAARSLANLLVAGLPPAELSVLFPVLLAILDDEEWLPCEGEASFSNTQSPLYAIAQVAERLEGEGRAVLTRRVQAIYASIRRSKLKNDDNNQWLSLMSRLNGRGRGEEQTGSYHWRRVNDIVSSYEADGRSAAVLIAGYVAAQASEVLNHLRQLDAREAGQFMKRIAAFKGAGVLFRDQLFEAIRGSNHSVLTSLLNKCALWIVEGSEGDGKAPPPRAN